MAGREIDREGERESERERQGERESEREWQGEREMLSALPINTLLADR